RFRIDLPGVRRPEPSYPLVIVPGAIVIDAQRRIELFAGKQVVVGRAPGGGEEIAESIIVVGVGDRTSNAGQEADASVAVVAVEAKRWCAGHRLVFVDQLQTVGVGPSDRAPLQFVNYLGVPGGILLGYQLVGRDPGHRFTYPIAAAVVHDAYAAALHQTVFEVVYIELAVIDQVAVAVVTVRGGAVVGIVAEQPCGGNRGHGGAALRAVAHGIV